MATRVSTERFWLLAFAFIVMIMCWEANRSNAALWAGPIPDQAIRVRVLAHSDSPYDQAVKSHIRDLIVAEMERRLEETGSIEEARAVIAARLPELDKKIGDKLAEIGYGYGHTIEFGEVEFPKKVFGGRTYPAGKYEALKVVLGSGRGENWWCVMFPPLCFVNHVAAPQPEKKANVAIASASVLTGTAEDGADGGSAGKAGGTAQGGSGSAKKEDLQRGGEPSAEAKEAADQAADSAQKAEKAKAADQPEKRFFLWDLIRKWFF